MGCRQYTPSSHATTLESNKSVKNKGLQEEIVTKIGLYDLGKSTTLESNKSLKFLDRYKPLEIERPTFA